MDRPIVLIKFVRRLTFLVLAVVLFSSQALGQGYEVSGECSLTGSITLTVYDGDSTSHSYTEKVNKGLFLFSGTVENPVLASLQHPSMTKPLFFFLENSDISIQLNASKPEVSHITGSRSNSEYRYVMECYRSEADPNGFLKQYLRKNSGSIYAPFILYQQMSSIDEEMLRQLVGQLQESACHTYHYYLLRKWMRETPSVSVGSEMPNFAYLDGNKERREFAQVRSEEGYTLIAFSASWCDICQQQRKDVDKAVRERDVKVVTINIDDNPNGWDAHYLQQLSVDHLPFMILIDRNGLVVARDVRAWELKGLLKK